MSARRSKIELLREKVNIMQKDLKTKKSIDKSLSKNHETMSPRNRDFAKENLNQTARYARPLQRPNKEALYQERARQPCNRKRDFDSIVKTLSPGLKDIIQHIDEHYYVSKPPVLDTQSISSDNEKILYQTSFIGKRYQYTTYTEGRNNCRQTYRKMFQHKKTDLILNPEKYNEGGLKIVKKLQKSPDQMLTQNPKSNPNLYTYKDKAVVIQNRGCLKVKNKSSLTFSRSIGEMTLLKSAASLNKTCTSQKKHFQKYVQDNLKSKIMESS